MKRYVHYVNNNNLLVMQTMYIYKTHKNENLMAGVEFLFLFCPFFLFDHKWIPPTSLTTDSGDTLTLTRETF